MIFQTFENVDKNILLLLKYRIKTAGYDQIMFFYAVFLSSVPNNNEKSQCFLRNEGLFVYMSKFFVSLRWSMVRNDQKTCSMCFVTILLYFHTILRICLFTFSGLLCFAFMMCTATICYGGQIFNLITYTCYWNLTHIYKISMYCKLGLLTSQVNFL